MMSDDTKELKTIEDQAKTRPLSVSDDADETKVLHSPDNETAAETEVLPTAADAVETSALPVVDGSIDETRPMTTAADGSATTVIPSADDNQESEDIVSDDHEKTIPLEAVADTSIPPQATFRSMRRATLPRGMNRLQPELLLMRNSPHPHSMWMLSLSRAQGWNLPRKAASVH